MTWLKKIGAFFAMLFSKNTADAIMRGIRAASPYISAAMEMSAFAATVVGGPVGKTAAAVLALAERYGVQALIQPDATDEQIGTAIRDTIAAALKAKFPAASVADLNRAIELAYGAVREK